MTGRFVKYHSVSLPTSRKPSSADEMSRGFVRMECLSGAPTHGSGRWRIYFAECSPSDQFSRPVGRAVVDSRAAAAERGCNRVVFAEIEYSDGGTRLTIDGQNGRGETFSSETRSMPHLPQFEFGPKYPTNEMIQAAYSVVQVGLRSYN